MNRKPTNSGVFAAQIAAQSISGGQSAVVRPKIGQIMIEAGFLDQHALSQCLVVSRRSAQLVGRVVSMLNYVADRDVESALLVQSLIGQGKISKQQAIQSLKEASRRKIAVTELLKSFGSSVSVATTSETDIGQLLTESRLITGVQLSHAVKVSEESGLRLCRSLLVTNAINHQVASKALHALALVRASKLTHGQAVSALDQIRKTSCSLGDALKKLNTTFPSDMEEHLLLGEMISRSGISTDPAILGAVETALIEGKKLGDTLIECNIITPEILDSALKLQEFANKRVILPEQSIFILKRLHKENWGLKQFAAQTDLFQDKSPSDRKVLKFLCACDAITDQDIVDAVKAQSDYRMGPIKALLASDKLPISLYHAAQDFASLAADGKVTEFDGINVLMLCREKGLTFINALASFGESVATEQTDIPVEFHKNNKSHEVSRAKVKRWFSLVEFKLFVMLTLVTPVAAYLCFTCAPEPYNIIGVWGLFIIAAFLLMLIGFSWRFSEASLTQAAFENLDSAREMKSRLSKLRR